MNAPAGRRIAIDRHRRGPALLVEVRRGAAEFQLHRLGCPGIKNLRLDLAEGEIAIVWRPGPFIGRDGSASTSSRRAGDLWERNADGDDIGVFVRLGSGGQDRFPMAFEPDPSVLTKLS